MAVLREQSRGQNSAYRSSCFHSISIASRTSGIAMLVVCGDSAANPQRALSATRTRQQTEKGNIQALVVADFAFAFDDAADGVVFFSGAVENAFGFLEFFGRHDQQHADSHVEGA